MLKYLFVYIVPAVVIFSISSSGIWTFTALIVLFGILPFAELFTKGSTENMTQAEEDIALKNVTYDLLPVSYTHLYQIIEKIGFNTDFPFCSNFRQQIEIAYVVVSGKTTNTVSYTHLH